MVTLSLPSLSTPPSARLVLEIPLEKIQSLCFCPVKWLRFVGWTIFHVPEGYLSRDLDGNDRLSDESPLTDEDFVYHQAPGFDQSAVLDMQVAAARRTVSRTSATTANQSDADFWETIRSRDEKCVFTHWHGEACHTIPHTQGDERIQMLSKERSIFPSIQDISDLRNGIMCSDIIHRLFDKREVAVLVTPNAILAREDVPQANINHPPNPADLRPQLLDLRYTLQFINTSDDDSCRLQCEYAPHNRDAKFMDAQPTSPPEPALLHYLYGAAILTAFGRSVPEWQAFGKQRQPRKESYPASRSFNKQTSENRALTRVKCDRVSPYPAESELAGGRRMTLDEAEEYMFNIASRQLAHREHARWAQRKLEINAWVSGCTEGNPGHTK